MTISKLEIVLEFYSPVWCELRQLLTHRDLLLMSLTSKSMRRLVFSALEQKQNIDKKLSRFVKDPSSFRLMLRDTGAVIAGEFARSFFLGRCSPKSLDVVVVDPRFYAGVKMTRWLRYLRRREAYSTSCMNAPFAQRGAQVSAVLLLLVIYN